MILDTWILRHYFRFFTLATASCKRDVPILTLQQAQQKIFQECISNSHYASLILKGTAKVYSFILFNFSFFYRRVAECTQSFTDFLS